MEKIIFTEEFCQPENLHPFTLTRQMQDIRVGILTIREKWEFMLGMPSFDKQEDDYKDLSRSIDLSEALKDGDACFMIHGNVLPSPRIIKAVKKLKNGEFLATTSGGGYIYRFTRKEMTDVHKIRVGHQVSLQEDVKTVQYPWDIVRLNEESLRQDFDMITKKRKSRPIPASNRVTRPSNVFLEKGAKVECSIINASTGPVYIGKNAEVMEGCMIRGPFALGENAILKMGSKVYGATSIGPNCIAGGEIKNAVMLGNSNKAHDGYLGDSVVGEWCNLGAGTSNSNLKNNAGDVKVWTSSGAVSAGIKCGVMMGDYSRTAVNTSINTGTVIGVGCNVFGSGLTPKHIPNFSWGSEGINRYDFNKAVTDINNWMNFKKQELSSDQLSILKYIFEKY